MIEIFDKQDISFLDEWEDILMQQTNKVQKDAVPAFSKIPQYSVNDKDIILQLLSNYDDIYPGWIRCTKFSYVFRFEPDKPTMLPHTDTDPETAKLIKDKAKRILIYATSIWKEEWNGGTYFAPFEKYGVNRHNAARCPKKRFAEEATLVKNVPGRAVVFDVDELHLPQEFSGNTKQRLVYSAILVHPDYPEIAENLRGSDNQGRRVVKLESP